MKRSEKNSRPFTMGETMELTSYITHGAYDRGYRDGYLAGSKATARAISTGRIQRRRARRTVKK